MTVPTIPTLSGGLESSSKLLNSNTNIEEADGSLSFNAMLNELAPLLEFEDQHYVLSDGQVLTAEQLLEMLENGNSLPGMNLPSLSELQHFKFQEGLSNTKLKPLINVAGNETLLPSDTTNKLMNDKFALTQQQFINQPLNQNIPLKAGSIVPEQYLVSLNAVTTQSNTEMPATGFTAAYGYHFASGPESTTGLTSNSFNIPTPVQHPQWNQSLGQSVKWMVNQSIQHAEIKLNPPDLGMLDIRITLNNDQATVHFAAPNSAVRDALESAMPRLRDMLEESGVTLADVNVSEYSNEHEQTEQNSENVTQTESNQQDDGANASLQNESDIKIQQIQIGLLDTYA
jgi:flagellar hook-length control protein FliK